MVISHGCLAERAERPFFFVLPEPFLEGNMYMDWQSSQVTFDFLAVEYPLLVFFLAAVLEVQKQSISKVL